MSISIVIADDQRICREGLRALFAAEAEIQVLAEAEDGPTLSRLMDTLSPHVVLMGMELPGLSAIEFCRQLANAKAATRIVGFATQLEAEPVRELLRIGGAGVVTKACAFSEFAAAVRSAVTKRIYLSPDVADVMLSSYVLGISLDRPNGASETLSEREREVLQLVAEGMSTKLVASQLKISTKTVDMHRQRIMDKLKLHSVAELTKYAIREGLTQLQ